GGTAQHPRNSRRWLGRNCPPASAVCSTQPEPRKLPAVATHYDDEDQAERLKQWWKENWMALAGGLVIGLAAIFGWEGWKSYQDKRSIAASRMYEELKLATASARVDDAQRIGDALVAEHARSPYASG